MNHWPRTDLHLHATHYRLQGAQPEMTVSNIVRRVERAGYAAAGIVEHLDTNPKHPLICLEALVAEFRALNSGISSTPDSSLTLYVGAELDYQGTGISIADAPAIKERLGLDYCLAAAHGVGEGITGTQAFIEDHHRRLMGIVESPYVDVIAHPWCGGHGFARHGRIEIWRFELVPERYLIEFIDAARLHRKAIELNTKALADANDPAFQHYLALLRASGVPVTVGSDAHAIERVGNVDPLNDLLQGAGFEPQRLWQPRAT